MDERQELKAKQEELGVSTIELAVEADLHPATIYRVYSGDGVSKSTLKRMRKALSRLQEAASPKSKTG